MTLYWNAVSPEKFAQVCAGLGINHERLRSWRIFGSASAPTLALWDEAAQNETLLDALDRAFERHDEDDEDDE